MSADEVAFLRDWADRNKARFEPEGQIGFGRECVGILARNDSYPAWEYDGIDGVTPDWVTADAAPPNEVRDAYHKGPYLAVLGRGDDAVHQLYLWVRQLDERGITIRMDTRPVSGDIVDLILHGTQSAELTRAVAP